MTPTEKDNWLFRRWIYATAVSMASSGLTTEKYNEITKRVISEWPVQDASTKEFFARQKAE